MYAQWGPPPPGYMATLRVAPLAGNGPLGDSNRAAIPQRTHSGPSTFRGSSPVSPKICRVPSASHEGTRQIFGETGLLPRNVLGPEWVRCGIAALFESPKGPFPAKGATLKVAMYPGGGGPHWAYMRYFEEMRDAKLLTQGNAAEEFLETVLDVPFRSARKAEQLEKALTKKAEEGDSKAVKSEELYNRARTQSWAL